jgi:hypothetical protein
MVYLKSWEEFFDLSTKLYLERPTEVIGVGCHVVVVVVVFLVFLVLPSSQGGGVATRCCVRGVLTNASCIV